MHKIITVSELNQYKDPQGRILLAAGQRLTPAAQDLVKERKWTLDWKEDEEYRCSSTACAGGQQGCGCESQPKDVQVQHYGVTRIALGDQRLDRFDCGFENAEVWLKDMITGRENPNLTAGLMSLRQGSQFPWHLDYDEIDLVLSGTFSIKVGDQLTTAKAGEVISIPHGTSLVFGTPDECLVYYVTYPANWNKQP